MGQGDLRDFKVPAGEVCRITIPPGIAHAVRNTGSEPGLMVCFNTVAHDPEKADTVQDVLLAPGPG